MQIGYLAALLGGALSLLSPCGALLLPAYFSSQTGAARHVLARTGVFLLGLLTVLAPLGAGVSAFGSLFTTNRALIVTVAGWVVVVLGVVQLCGGGFDLGRLVPDRLRSTGDATAWGAAYLLGLASAVAGFCSGPILGSILTIAATGGSAVLGALLLSVYAVGMLLPLVVLSLIWRRWRGAGRNMLRGRQIRLGPVRTHTTSVFTGVVLIAVGALFLTTNGLATAPELVSADVVGDLQLRASELAACVPDGMFAALVVALALGAWWIIDRRERRP